MITLAVKISLTDGIMESHEYVEIEKIIKLVADHDFKKDCCKVSKQPEIRPLTSDKRR